jgi:hypothetical protein
MENEAKKEEFKKSKNYQNQSNWSVFLDRSGPVEPIANSQFNYHCIRQPFLVACKFDLFYYFGHQRYHRYHRHCSTRRLR